MPFFAARSPAVKAFGFTSVPYIISYLSVAGGGGGGGGNCGGGAGAGGYLTNDFRLISGTTYTVTVGGGGSGGVMNGSGANGSASSIAGTGLTTVSSTGGGYGGAGWNSTANGGNGGSGGGAGSFSGGGGGSSGTGVSGQGNNGGTPSAASGLNVSYDKKYFIGSCCVGDGKLITGGLFCRPMVSWINSTLLKKLLGFAT